MDCKYLQYTHSGSGDFKVSRQDTSIFYDSFLLYNDSRHVELSNALFFIVRTSSSACERVHYMLMLLVVILTSVGVYSAVAKQHKNPLPIIHAVLGWTTMVFFSLQLLLGGGAISMVRLNPNHGLIQLHRIVGPSVQAAFTAALIDGILLKCRDVYCLVLVASVALTTIFSAFCIVSSE